MLVLDIILKIQHLIYNKNTLSGYFIMDTFRIIVLSIATILLVLILVFVGILLSGGKQNTAFPPNYGECPDYWVYDDKDGQQKCIIPEYSDSAINIGNMYGDNPDTSPILTSSVTSAPGYSSDISNNITINSIDFNNSGWSGICDIKTWCNENGIIWDGISNYNNC